MKDHTISAIGIIHTPYKKRDDAPRQAAYSNGARGTIEIFPQYERGLKGLENYPYIILIFYFDRNQNTSLTACPPGQQKTRGVFATRSPHRPNNLGLSVVKLEKIEGNKIFISDLDMLDGTLLIDIKPYISDLDCK